VAAWCAAVHCGHSREDYLASPDELVGSAIIEAVFACLRPSECVQPEVTSPRRCCDHAGEKALDEPAYSGLDA
jgi:hypothetical protein